MEGIIKTLEKDDTEWALKQIEVTFIHITVETSHTLAILGTMESDFLKRLKIRSGVDVSWGMSKVAIIRGLNIIITVKSRLTAISLI